MDWKLELENQLKKWRIFSISGFEPCSSWREAKETRLTFQGFFFIEEGGCMVDSLYERIKDIENTLWKLQMRLNIWILIKNLGTITFSSYNFLFYLNIEQANWKAHRSVISCVHQIDISNMNQWNRCSRGTNTKTRKPLIRKN